MVFASSWSIFKFFDCVDFSPAVIAAGPSTAGNKPGHPTFFNVTGGENSRMARNVLNIIGKDLQGNVWVMMRLLPSCWEKIEAELKKLG